MERLGSNFKFAIPSSDKYFNATRNRGRQTFPINEGYVYKGNAEEISNDFYPKMGVHNPIAKILLIVHNTTEKEAKEILKDGYEGHKILNSAILVKKSNQDKICVYDPFYRYAIFKCLNITNETYKETIAKIEAFAAVRIRDLQNYPMKVKS